MLKSMAKSVIELCNYKVIVQRQTEIFKASFGHNAVADTLKGSLMYTICLIHPFKPYEKCAKFKFLIQKICHVFKISFP